MKRPNNGGRLRRLVTLIISLLILTACAKEPSVVYLNDSSRPLQMQSGETAPFDGWLLSPGALVDLMNCCEGTL